MNLRKRACLAMMLLGTGVLLTKEASASLVRITYTTNWSSMWGDERQCNAIYDEETQEVTQTVCWWNVLTWW